MQQKSLPTTDRKTSVKELSVDQIDAVGGAVPAIIMLGATMTAFAIYAHRQLQK